jgi:signal transduction histidine kinase
MPTLIRLPRDAPPGENLDFSGLFDAAPEPLAYIGPDRTLAACNRRFRELFPVVVEERLLQCLPPAPGPTIASRQVTIASNPATSAFVPPFVADGRRLAPRAKPLADGGMLISFEDAAAPPDVEQALRGAVAGLSTELYQTRQALDKALDKAARRKNALIATSHELRTPLNAIIGFAEMMQQETFGPLGHERYREYAGVIRESGGYLLNLINDLLDLAKLDAGKSDLRLDRVEILKVVVDCVKAIEPLAARSNIGMAVHVYDGVSQIVGDDMRLHQMLLNLLSNAVKFGQGGEISIEVFRRGRFIGISVSDTGLGISQADIARVLEPFEQAGDARRGEKTGGAMQGTGLGLPLTRELAHLHGGDLKMESVVGEGTTITILLPADGPSPGPHKKSRAAAGMRRAS